MLAFCTSAQCFAACHQAAGWWATPPAHYYNRLGMVQCYLHDLSSLSLNNLLLAAETLQACSGQVALERQHLPCTHLACHELKSAIITAIFSLLLLLILVIQHIGQCCTIRSFSGANIYKS